MDLPGGASYPGLPAARPDLNGAGPPCGFRWTASGLAHGCGEHPCHAADHRCACGTRVAAAPRFRIWRDPVGGVWRWRCEFCQPATEAAAPGWWRIVSRSLPLHRAAAHPESLGWFPGRRG